MRKTAVGLFEDARRVDEAISQVEALGFPQNEVRSVEEPATFEISGVMSFPRLDFEVELRRDLTRIGATKTQIEACVDGLRQGGTLVFVTGSDQDNKVDAAAEVMNHCGAVGIGEAVGAEPVFPRVARANMAPAGESSALTGRVRQQAEGACMFVW